jgi:uncharacterized protein (TIGR00369 family)
VPTDHVTPTPPESIPPGRTLQPGTLSGVVGSTQGHMGDRMGIEILEATVERVVGRMPVAGNTQPYGLLHGGASCVLAESLGSVGAALHAGEGRYVVGVDINATHHRGATEGWVTGVATPLFLGRSAATYAIAITRDDGKLVCSARLTCMVRDA